jgi:hemolysin activation/secretion protein
MALDLPPAAPPVAAVVAPAEDASSTMFVDSHGFRYAVTGNTLLPAALVRATIEGAATPKDALQALNEEYVKRGYFLTAIKGEVSRQLVSITVLQGRITETDLAPGVGSYFTGLEGQDDLNRNTILRRTALAEFYSSRQGMRPVVGFAKAEAAGGSRITVTEEPIPDLKPWSAGLSFGNLGSRFSSRYIASAQGAVRPGGGLELTAGYTQGLPGITAASAGSQYQSANLGGSLVTPWGIYGVSYNGIRYKIGERAAPLFPEGDIDVFAVNGVQLVYADETTRWSLSEAFTHTVNVVQVFDRSYTLTDQEYEFITLGTVVNKSTRIFEQNANIGVGLTGMFGISPPKGTFLPIDVGVPNTRFAIIQANVNYQQALPAGYLFNFSLNGQWADSTVPQNQQWVLGGLGNLSAWMPAVVVGDMGGLGRASVNTPSWTWDKFSVSAAAYVEAGIARFYYTPPDFPTTRSLADAGVSLQGTVAGGTSLTLAYAVPVYYRNVDRQIADPQRSQVYFSLSQSF